MPPRGGTAWTSDLIRPPTQKPSVRLTAQTPSKSDKGKGRAATPEPPRSAAVRNLDELLAGLGSSSSSEPTRSRRHAQDGCFCQARAHALSEYTPLCSACGLVLCALHAPYRPCPHCAAPLLDSSARHALIVLLDERRAHTLAEEAAARVRAAEELRLAEGAFPALGGGAAPGAAGKGAGAGGGAGARVLSVDAQTKRVRVVESYRAPGAGDAAAEEEGGEDGGGVVVAPRVPPPEREVQYLRVPRGPATRWAVSKDGEGGAAKYVAPPPAPRTGQSDRAAGRRGKGKARDVVGSVA